MAFDAVTVRCLVSELSDKLTEGRIDKIYQPERDEISIHVRTFKETLRLVLSANSSQPRVHLTSHAKKNPATAPLFCMLLRKHIGSGKIKAIEQQGFERVITFFIESYDELGMLTQKKLIAEIMGRNSNIILCDAEDKVIDAIKRVDLTVSSYRQILPGLKYQSPPAQQKTELTDFDYDTKIDFTLPESADKTLLNAVSGISPLTAREIVCRAFGRTDVMSNELNLNKQSLLKTELYKFSNEVKQNKFSPCLITDAVSGKIMDFSAFDIRQYGEMAKTVPYESINELLDDFYSLRDMHERMRQKSADLVKLITSSTERLSKKLVILKKTLQSAEKKELYKIYGDLIMTNLYRIEQGAETLAAQNYYEEELPMVTISLDPSLSPSANAQRYYKKYMKSKTAETEAANQIKIALSELDYLESTLAAVENAENETDLNAVRRELADEGYISRRSPLQKKKQPVSEPLHFVSADGFDIYVGKNNTQNDYLTLKLANSSDIWFHTKNIHGSHTVIKLGQNKDVPKTTLLHAAKLAAYYSKARNSSQVPVDYTMIKNVKKPHGAKPGMVIYEHYNTVYVTPEKPE